MRDIIRSLLFLFSREKPLYRALKNILGYYPRNIQLFKIALSHRAVPHRLLLNQNINNERLEYLGDAVLSSIIADYLYRKFPQHNEGFLTEMRSRIVSRSRFNRLAIKMGIDRLIFAQEEYRSTSKSIFGDTFEAIIGAVYLDRGYRFTRRLVIHRIIGVHVDIEEVLHTETNFKSRILEYVQKEKKQLEFKVVQEVGEGYQKQYRVEIIIDGEAVASGQDFSIKGAEQVAAERACEKLLGEPEE